MLASLLPPITTSLGQRRITHLLASPPTSFDSITLAANATTFGRGCESHLLAFPSTRYCSNGCPYAPVRGTVAPSPGECSGKPSQGSDNSTLSPMGTNATPNGSPQEPVHNRSLAPHHPTQTRAQTQM